MRGKTTTCTKHVRTRASTPPPSGAVGNAVRRKGTSPTKGDYDTDHHHENNTTGTIMHPDNATTTTKP